MTPTATEITVLAGLAVVAFISLILVVLVYGLLTPWWKSRTGIGFMSVMCAFLIAIALSVANRQGIVFPIWVYYGAWGLIIVTINLGVTWNIIYKQFFQHRGDEVADKSAAHLKQTGVASDVLTGEIPIHQGDRNDRGI